MPWTQKNPRTVGSGEVPPQAPSREVNHVGGGGHECQAAAASVAGAAPASAASAASVRDTAFTTAPMRTAAWICSVVNPALRSSASCESMHAPHPFTAETAIE